MAEAAQKALADVTSLANDTKSVEASNKTLLSDAQAGKKQVDGAVNAATAAEQGIPAAPPVAAPQGKDPKDQYDSAIQITGKTRTTQQDGDAKAGTVREQEGVAAEGTSKIDTAYQGANKNADKLKKSAESAAELAEAAANAANGAKAAADQSKQKADQAVKDKSPDKDTLQKTAQEDAQHVRTAQDAAAKAKSAVQQINTAATNAATQTQNIEKLKQEASKSTDAIKQKTSGLDAKLKPLADSVAKSEQQEAECKAKLSEEDAQAVLQRRYEKLGGDPELSKALAAEDKEFETRVELFKAKCNDAKKDTIRKLDEYKEQLQKTLDAGDAIIPPAKQFVEKETPLGEKAKGELDAQGEKLKTEPGKEVLHELTTRLARIAKVKQKTEYNEKVIEKTKASMEAIEERYKDVDAEYEAAEKYIKEVKTEVDNQLQMDNMSLEQKVDFLQTRPKIVRDRVQKQLDGELTRVVKASSTDTMLESSEFREKWDAMPQETIDWTPVTEGIAKLNSKTLEELKQDDPKLAGIQEEYEKAGGDPALLEKRTAQWKDDVAANEHSIKEQADSYLQRSEKLRAQYDEAQASLRDGQNKYNKLDAVLTEKKKRFKELSAKLNPMSPFADFTEKEKDEYTLLDRDIKRLETDLKNISDGVAARRKSRDDAEKVVETERQRSQQVVDYSRTDIPKPTSEEIHAMPLRAKYTELTGKAAPA